MIDDCCVLFVECVVCIQCFHFVFVDCCVAACLAALPFIVVVMFVFMLLSCACFDMHYSCHVEVVIMLKLWIVVFTLKLWIDVLWSAISFKFVDCCVMVFTAALALLYLFPCLFPYCRTHSVDVFPCSRSGCCDSNLLRREVVVLVVVGVMSVVLSESIFFESLVF